MGKKKTIDHIGIIQEISAERILVKIENHSACSGCHAKGACSVADVKDKIIEIDNPKSIDFNIGDRVNVICDEELGFIALFWAYLCPLILVLTTLFIGSIFIDSEKIYGIISVLILIPYYLILRLFKDKLRKRFNFRIEK